MKHCGTASGHRAKKQHSENVKCLKTPNALFQINLQFQRELSGFIPRLPAYGMAVMSIDDTLLSKLIVILKYLASVSSLTTFRKP